MSPIRRDRSAICRERRGDGISPQTNDQFKASREVAAGTAAVLSPPLPEERARTPLRPPSDAGENMAPPSIYTRLLADALPRLLHVADPAPWRDGAAETPEVATGSTRVSFRRQSATLAMAMLIELDSARADSEYLTEVIRSSLIRWQLSLRGDGRPLRCRDLSSPFHGATLGRVIQLLSETTGFQTTMLLGDVERHLRWVTHRPVAAPWLEAAAICAMADGAVFVRDGSLLSKARGRLAGLLETQDTEGWFPENGGADIGRLSLTVDALARMYHQNGWEELDGVLRRALGFLAHFVHPDGSVGGCYGARASAFWSPYFLASSMVAVLASAQASAFPGWSRDCWYVARERSKCA